MMNMRINTMRAETAAVIQEYFAGSKWASSSSSRHEQASQVLAEFTHEEIVQACKTMRASLTRTHCTAEELAGEVKRNQRKEAVQARAEREGYNPFEVEQHRAAMRSEIEAADPAKVRAVVNRLRLVGALGGEPLPADRAKWSFYTVGVVWAGLNRVEV
jgi:hypothetical protein